MSKVIIQTDLCKGCGLCIEACPKKIIGIAKHAINAKGHHPAVVLDEELCISCAFCATMCPDCVISVQK
ncbi:MAG: 4Fe-4S binding protein [Firmicutes bacterium]|nr:4Fe-4S binding protein [Bacillota bacterium]